MLYEIKLSGTEQDDGKISLYRIGLLSQSMTDIASAALRLRLMGVSTERGRKNDRFINAININLSNLKKGSTILELECSPFSETLAGQQGDAFNAEILEKLPTQTPITLIIESFRAALNYKEESNQLDKGLLKKLKHFEKVFISDKESVTFTNQGSISELSLKQIDFKKIQQLEESIPESQKIIVNGIVDELKYSKSRILIATKEGAINGILSDSFEPEEIAKYWGKSLTIKGTAHYQPNGKMSFIVIEKIFEPGEADQYFSRTSKKETIEQQIQRQQKQFKQSNHINEIVGQWPDDEALEEILNDLD